MITARSKISGLWLGFSEKLVGEVGAAIIASFLESINLESRTPYILKDRIFQEGCLQLKSPAIMVS